MTCAFRMEQHIINTFALFEFQAACDHLCCDELVSSRCVHYALRCARVGRVNARACTSLLVGALSMEDTMACENRLSLNVVWGAK